MRALQARGLITVFALVASMGCGRFNFGAAEVDAGSSDLDATLPDLDAAPLATTCGLAPSLLCDGFESGTLTAWRSETGAGIVTVETDAPSRGAFALRATAAVGGHAYLAADLTAITGGEVHVRGYVRIPSGTSIEPTGYLQLLRIGQESDPGHVHVMLDSQDKPVVWPQSGVYTATLPLARDRWLCLTLAVRIDSTNGGFELTIDGAPYLSVPGLALVSSTGGFDEFSVGVIGTSAAQPQITIGYDEITVSSTPLACD